MNNLFSKRNVIILSIVVVLLLSFAVYFFGTRSQTQSPIDFFRGIFPGGGADQPTSQQSSITPAEQTAIQILQEQGPRGLPQWTLVQLGDDPIASLVSFGTTTRYHKITPQNLGHMFERQKSTLDQEKRMSNLLIQKIARVDWSPRGNKAVVTYYNDEQDLQKFLIEYLGTTTPKTHFLENSMIDAAFSPAGDKIAYIDTAGGNNDIFIADTGFKGAKKIFENNIPGFEISWPTANVLALKSKSSYAADGYLYTLGAGGGTLKKIAQGLGLDAVFSSDGRLVFYTTVNTARRPQPAGIYELKTAKTQALPINTIAEKCVFGKENPIIVYCGVPQFIPAGLYPDAWWQGKVSFADSIVVIDTSTMRQIQSVATQSDIIDPVIFDDDSYLFFRDKTTDRLWALKLKDDTTGTLPPQ